MECNSESGVCAKEYIKESVKLVGALDWWKRTFKSLSLSKIAVGILGLLCTSAAAERSFETYSWIHNSKCGRLNNIRAGKLVCLNQNFNQLFLNKK